MVMTDLPTFGSPKVITTIHEGGKWKIPGPGTPGEDNHGDGQMIVDETAGLYRMIYRSGGTAVGGVYVEKPLDGDPWSGWSVPGGPADPTRSIAAHDPTNSQNLDSFGLIRNPATGVITCIYSAKPGSVGEGPGFIHTVQRRTSIAPHTNLHLDANWAHYGATHEIQEQDPPARWHRPRPEFSGGLEEASILFDPSVNLFVMFYEAKSQDESNPEWGTIWKNRIGRATAPLAGFDAGPTWTYTPALAENSSVFDPELQPGYVHSLEEGTPPFGTMPGFTQRCHVSINPFDGSYHMILIGQTPHPQASVRNRFQGFGHWYSHDRGLTWTAGSNNPIIDYDILGWDPDIGIANRLNSPYLMWDEVRQKVYLGFWGNETGEQNQLGTKFYMAVADVAVGASEGSYLSDILQLWGVPPSTSSQRLVVPLSPVPYPGRM